MKNHSLALFVLRFGLGVVFIAHGLQKAFGLFGGAGIQGFAESLSGLGFYPPLMWAYIGAYVELLGGICLILGLGVRTASFLLLVLITVAGVKVHLQHGFFLMNRGYEYTFVIACVCISLILQGGGKYSLGKKF